MAAGLRPDPLGELKRSPDPLVAIRGATYKGRGREGTVRKGREGEGRGRGRERGRGNLLQGVRGDKRPCKRQINPRMKGSLYNSLNILRAAFTV